MSNKVTVEFDSIEQAAIAVAAVTNAHIPAQYHATPAAAPAPAPHVAPAPVAQPAPLAAPMQPAPAPANFAAPALAGQPAAPVAAAAPVASGITAAQVAAAAQAYAKDPRFGPKGAKAVLAQFGATSIGTVNPANYPALLQALAV